MSKLDRLVHPNSIQYFALLFCFTFVTSGYPYLLTVCNLLLCISKFSVILLIRIWRNDFSAWNEHREILERSQSTCFYFFIKWYIFEVFFSYFSVCEVKCNVMKKLNLKSIFLFFNFFIAQAVKGEGSPSPGATTE